MGLRVVVRRLVPGETGPSGGPAMTDLLGVCTSWGDQECVVQPESGPAVTIRLVDVVSGKPVPPRPSVRQRVSAREAEGHALVMWPTVATAGLGDWVLRTETEPRGRLLKRANSALAIGEPDVPLDDALARVVAFYATHDREPLLQVEAGSVVHAHAVSAGWDEVDGGASTFLLGSVSRALRACGSSGAAPAPVLVEDGPRAHVVLEQDGRVLAQGRAAYDGDWLGVHALHVSDDQRRRGLATALMAELLDWGASHGARTLWLHVEVDNDPALALYERLGLLPHHDLAYLRPSGGG
ncbi:conserved hypothetical protein [Nocardioides sp. AX2bis]|nr:conserved hypothetical protein [Nocardioides sp. AX2bis]